MTSTPGIALRLAEEGARVVVGDLREVQGRELAARIGGSFRRCDVAAGLCERKAPATTAGPLSPPGRGESA